jgi:heat shock protein HslJ
MKRFSMLAALLALCGMMALQGCCGKTAAADNKIADVKIQDLAGKSFALVKISGREYKFKNTPTLSFNEQSLASGSFCNRFTGQAEFDNGVLTIRQMAGTRMLCLDQAQNQLEADAAQMLMNGAAIGFDGKVLTLTRDSCSLEYRLKDE